MIAEHPGPCLVSVVIPAYNVSGFIAETLASVDAQTFRHFETIVVNDGSPDTPELEAVLQPWLNNGSIVYLKQRQTGASGARNLAIRHARGEFLAFLDADDLWLPEYLERQVERFRSDPALDMHYTDMVLFGDPEVEGFNAMRLSPSERPVTLESLIEERSVPLTSATVVRRAAVIEAGCFDETITHTEDFDLWLRLALLGKRIDFQETVLARRRLRPGSCVANPQSMYSNAIAVYEKLLREPRLPDGARRRIPPRIRLIEARREFERGKQLLRDGQYKAAIEAFRAANRTFRNPKLALLVGGLHLAPGLTAALVKRRWTKPGEPRD
jgi:glycosyltransferase involved in cell wall biosynthesis